MIYIKEAKNKNPQLMDIPIEQLKEGLLKNILWLDQAFGRVYKIQRNVGGKRYTEPCIYCGDERYETLIPSEELGNYSFFVLHDPTEVTEDFVRANVSIIFWVDLRQCYGNDDVRCTENVKSDIVKALVQDIWVRGASFTVKRVYEEGKKVFEGFTIDENDAQMLMQPYAAFRVDGVLNQILQTC